MHTNTWQLARLVPRRGYIALQIHGGTQRWAKDAKCCWRNIRFRPVAGDRAWSLSALSRVIAQTTAN